MGSEFRPVQRSGPPSPRQALFPTGWRVLETRSSSPPAPEGQDGGCEGLTRAARSPQETPVLSFSASKFIIVSSREEPMGFLLSSARTFLLASEAPTLRGGQVAGVHTKER